jgi:hypothetical protein
VTGRGLLVPAVLAAVAMAAAAGDPMADVNGSRSVAELENVLLGLANKNDDRARCALLWGSVLYEGFRDRKAKFPYPILKGGIAAADRRTASIGMQAMQVWWLSTIGQTYVPPNLKDGRIVRYIEVTENGVKKKEPVWASESDDRAAERLRQMRKDVLRSADDSDERLVFLWWQESTASLVGDTQIVAIAQDRNSPFRDAAIGELSLRELRRGKPGAWAEAWLKVKFSHKTLVVEAVATREIEWRRSRR